MLDPKLETVYWCLEPDIFNKSLHPMVTRGLPRNPNIADIGTASGRTLFQLAETLHTVGRLDGFDISSKHFHSLDRPEQGSVTLYEHDARKPFPTRFRGLYDVVCMQNMFADLEEGEWALVARNITEILKPSGVLQLSEPELRRVWQSTLNTPLRDNYLRAVYHSWVQYSFGRRAYGLENLRGVPVCLGYKIVQRDQLSFPMSTESLATCERVLYEAWLGARTMSDDSGILKTMKRAMLNEVCQKSVRHDRCVIIGLGVSQLAANN
ncbi:MAG: hypothetical protein M1828_001043 [Chrysothrix sp. TS-e1954]|nr:MAG: hypothetical protein M1828_001043 [Chrysothrix sp. TS-e1954]